MIRHKSQIGWRLDPRGAEGEAFPPPATLYFRAGLNHEADGLFGVYLAAVTIAASRLFLKDGARSSLPQYLQTSFSVPDPHTR